VKRRSPDPLLEAVRSIPDLLKSLAIETTVLVRQELQLAQAEIAQKVRRSRSSAGLIGAAALVTAAYGVVVGVAAHRGLTALKTVDSPVPLQTMETLCEDAEAGRAGAQRAR
jgi:hypothetical protein